MAVRSSRLFSRVWEATATLSQPAGSGDITVCDRQLPCPFVCISLLLTRGVRFIFGIAAAVSFDRKRRGLPHTLGLGATFLTDRPGFAFTFTKHYDSSKAELSDLSDL